jgi:hypothetical protein
MTYLPRHDLDVDDLPVHFRSDMGCAGRAAIRVTVAYPTRNLRAMVDGAVPSASSASTAATLPRRGGRQRLTRHGNAQLYDRPFFATVCESTVRGGVDH